MKSIPSTPFEIKPLKQQDIALVTKWARNEGFTPGIGDVAIYRHTDRQGLWVGWLGNKPIGCIAGVKYNSNYGFIGLFLVLKEHRGNGYGLKLWRHALSYLAKLPSIGLEAALARIDNYHDWGFQPSSTTTRWQLISNGSLSGEVPDSTQLTDLSIYEGHDIPANSVHLYDAKREPSPRPHFLSDWLNHPSGKVLALIDHSGNCHGFGRIRPCLLQKGKGWRIGPLIADTPSLAELLLRHLVQAHPGVVLLDSPGLNAHSKSLYERLGFEVLSETLRMYKGIMPTAFMQDVYSLACLELG